MSRFVDIVQVHDGESGPAGVPSICVEHDGTRSLGVGETRFTVDEYRAQEPTWRAAYEAWAAQRLPPPAPPPLRIITPLAFRRRLPPARRVELTTLAQSQPMLRAWLDDLTAAREIDLDDPELVAALDQLVGAGILTAAEAAALRADPTPEEVAGAA